MLHISSSYFIVNQFVLVFSISDAKLTRRRTDVSKMRQEDILEHFRNNSASMCQCVATLLVLTASL